MAKKMEEVMKRVSLLGIAFFLLAAVALWSQSLENAGIDYTTALQQKPGAQRIKAFEDYIRNYPDVTANMFTKFAYYWLAYDNYNVKNYGEAIRYGDKAAKIGVPEKKLEAALYLIMANSFGVPDSPKFNKDQAIRNADRAAAFAQENGFSDIAKQASSLKRQLTEPAQPKAKEPAANVDKMRLYYAQKDFNKVVSFYGTLGDADKKDLNIIEVYAGALIQLNRIDAAIEKLNEFYRQSKKGKIADKLAEAYQTRSEREKKQLDQAVNYYIEASLLYKKEGDRTRADNMVQNAKYWLYEKYDFNQKVKKYNATVKTVKPPPDNSKEIKKLEREYEQLERKLAEQYGDMEMPAYEQDKLDAITAKIDKLKQQKSGGTPQNQEEAAALEKERLRIESEYQSLESKAKTRLGI